MANYYEILFEETFCFLETVNFNNYAQSPPVEFLSACTAFPGYSTSVLICISIDHGCLGYEVNSVCLFFVL